MYQRKKRQSVEEYVNGVMNGDKIILSKAITLVESTLESDHLLAEQVIEQILPYTGNSVRIGITGVPGVGKSTFIESFGKVITTLQKKLAVLAIDPSSQRSKGSILGDKTRMEKLSVNPLAYIRPSASGSSLGGVSTKTRETMLFASFKEEAQDSF
jgi:LAO/AO transport system kinase